MMSALVVNSKSQYPYPGTPAELARLDEVLDVVCPDLPHTEWEAGGVVGFREDARFNGSQIDIEPDFPSTDGSSWFGHLIRKSQVLGYWYGKYEGSYPSYPISVSISGEQRFVIKADIAQQPPYYQEFYDCQLSSKGLLRKISEILPPEMKIVRLCDSSILNVSGSDKPNEDPSFAWVLANGIEALLKRSVRDKRSDLKFSEQRLQRIVKINRSAG